MLKENISLNSAQIRFVYLGAKEIIMTTVHKTEYGRKMEHLSLEDVSHVANNPLTKL